MRVLLDCRPLQGLGADHETTRLVMAASRQMADREGFEWVFLVNKRGGDLFSTMSGEAVLRGAKMAGTVLQGKGEVARVFFNHRWTVSRVKRRYRCEKVLNMAGLVLPPAVDPGLAALSMEEREEMKRRFAYGKEYFYADVNGRKEGEVVELLKAFSKFKKRQKSNMQLVLAGAAMGEKMATYKYREDVHVGEIEKMEGVMRGAMAGAYAVIIEKEEPGLDMLEAWTMGVPVIRMAYSDPGLDEQLKSIYKDERLRNELIAQGTARSKDYSWERTREAINGYLAGC